MWVGIGFCPKPTLAEEEIAPKQEFSIVLFTPREAHDHFWGPFADFMSEAADDFGIRLEVQFAGGSRNMMAEQIREVCKRAEKPDGVVFQSFKRGGQLFLRIADRHGVPAFLVNAGLPKKQSETLGEPRTQLKHWLGQMLPSDYEAGFQLANALIDEASRDPLRFGDDGKVHVIGFNGIVSDSASAERFAGLQKAIAQRQEEAVLDQVVAADWNQELARRRCRVLHRRHPSASVVWSASDPMALGAMQALQEIGLTPGKDIIIGGVDATPEAMEAIEQGTLFATVGGHVLEGGWTVVLLHDFFPWNRRGKDSNSSLIADEIDYQNKLAHLSNCLWPIDMEPDRLPQVFTASST